MVTFDPIAAEKFMAQKFAAAGITTNAQRDTAIAAIDPETVQGRARMAEFIKALASCFNLSPPLP
jgi:hypothetical protein